jgi:hypothetical protein
MVVPLPPQPEPELSWPPEDLQPADLPKHRRDGFAVLAFWLAVVIMVMPTEADIVHSLLYHSGGIELAILVATLCFVTVLAPVALSWRRRWRQPRAWRDRGYLIAASVILAANLLIYGAVIIEHLSRKRA